MMYDDKQIRKVALSEKAKLLWKNIEKWGEDRYRRMYSQELLPLELEYIECYRDTPTPELQGRALVLMVGDSIEPLLISACLWKPKHIILVLNQAYNSSPGKSRYQEVKDIMATLPEQYLTFDIAPFNGTLEADDPKGVFSHLQKHLAEEEDYIIDITGGKKSMVAGAFLYAAYSNAEISYVDFLDYDSKHRRPYGYTCEVKRLTNPYNDFALRDWEKVRELYESGAYGAAIQVLENMRKIIDPALFNSKHQEAAERLLQLLRLYKAWDSSDYQKARCLATKFDDLKSELPAILFYSTTDLVSKINPDQLLDNTKDEIRSKRNDALSKVYKDRELCYVYAKDELHKGKRLIEDYEDYRAALVRLAAASEFMLECRIEFNKTDEDDDGPKKRSITEIIKHLENKAKKTCRTKQLLPLLPDIGKLAEIRNGVVHGVLPVSKCLARQASAIAEENLANFRLWVSGEINHDVYEAISWNRVREVCGLSFVPEVRGR